MASQLIALVTSLVVLREEVVEQTQFCWADVSWKKQSWEPLYIMFSIHVSPTARSSALIDVSGIDPALLEGELFWNQRGRRILCLACYEQPLATKTTLDWICFAARWISLLPVGPDQPIHPAQSPDSSRLFPTRPLVPVRPWTQRRAAEPGSMMGDGWVFLSFCQPPR